MKEQNVNFPDTKSMLLRSERLFQQTIIHLTSRVYYQGKRILHQQTKGETAIERHSPFTGLTRTPLTHYSKKSKTSYVFFSAPCKIIEKPWKRKRRKGLIPCIGLVAISMWEWQMCHVQCSSGRAASHRQLSAQRHQHSYKVNTRPPTLSKTFQVGCRALSWRECVEEIQFFGRDALGLVHV